MRAYTYIDRTTAIVGNRWIERRWSPFLGATESLVDKADGFDWINGACNELGFDIDGKFHEPVDLGEAVWQEDNSPLGATLTCIREQPRLEVHVVTLAYHDMPAMLRTIRLLNKSGKPVNVRRRIFDCLPMKRKTFHALVQGFRESHPSILYESDERAVALQLKHRGLIFGHEAAATYELRDPDPTCCVIACNTSVAVEPGRWFELPAAYIIPYRGPVADASRTRFADFLAHRRDIEEAEKGDGSPDSSI